MMAFALILSGTALVVAAIAMAFNTSMGGTRSDHDDGSNLLATVGAVVGLVGVIVFFARIIQ